MRPTLADVRQAARRITGHAHRTPIHTSESIDRVAGASLFFKCENLQKVGAFKMRGAANAVFALPDDVAPRGVCTHSSGNHAQAVARAALRRGVPATIVMPRTAPRVKRAAVEGHGARVVECEPTLAAREAGVADVVAASGAHLVHPYDDPLVIAGQGTAALELIEALPDLDLVIVPVGGGGLLSGTAITLAEATGGRTLALGAEPAGADDAHRSLSSGRLVPSIEPRTVCDGLLTSLSERTFDILRELVEEIVTVDDAATVAAMRLLWERTKLVVEPSSAVPLAAILADPGRFAGQRIGVILTGGNVDLDHLPFGAPPR